MTKFNTTTKGETLTKNHEGAVAYNMDSKTELYSAVVTTMMSPKFYETEADILGRIKSLVSTVASKDPEFVARLAVYARTEMNLRTVSIVLAVELAKVHNGDDLVSRLVGKVVCRADEIAELLAYYSLSNGVSGTKKLGKLSTQIKKGLCIAFNKFDAYQFAKWNRSTTVKLKDALFIVHPKAKDKAQQEIFDQIASDTLPTPKTWEVELSKGEDKKESWEDMINSEKMGYMATLRNVRNFLQADISGEAINKVIESLTNGHNVRNAKQLPFRFYSAYRELGKVEHVDAPRLMQAIDTAATMSTHNLPGFHPEDKVYVSVDTSGSMGTDVSENSTISYQDIGMMCAMMLHNITERIETSVFGQSLASITLTKGNILGNVEKASKFSGIVGHSTNGYLIPKYLIQEKKVFDKVVVFTDCQMYDNTEWGMWGGGGEKSFKEYWSEYKKNVAPDSKLYIFDLAGYGKTPLSIQENDVHLISGWSEKIFSMIEATESGSTVVAEIEKMVV